MVLVAALAAACPAWQAQRVAPANTHHRIIALVPVVSVIENGETIRRPAHTAGQVAWRACYSIDGSMALIEVVSLRRQDQDRLRSDASPGVRVFDKSRVRPEVIKAAARAAGFRAEDVEDFFAKSQVNVR
jgi:hypothetical protein